jgi:hypothetical protein
MSTIMPTIALKKVDYSKLRVLQKKLMEHKIYNAVNSKKNINIFMQYHVFAVWDFMLLLK